MKELKGEKRRLRPPRSLFFPFFSFIISVPPPPPPPPPFGF